MNLRIVQAVPGMNVRIAPKPCPHHPAAEPRCAIEGSGTRLHHCRKTAMNFKFHHMNLCTDSLPRLTQFYKTLFDLGTINDEEHTRVDASSDRTGYNGKVDFLTDGDIEFHWAERDLNTGFKMNQIVNPMARGHFCFRTDDIKGFMRRCDERGIRYSDYGKWAIAGWHQVFLQDPDGNVIEIHQPGL
jgi:catechol 2,3-dioxygenase-like lactoylglutathione lyase family enzyme